MLAAAALWSVLALPASAATAKILRYSDHHPPEEMRSKFLREVFFPAVERESGGRLKIEAHWDGALADSRAALHAAGEGRVVDMALVVPEYMGDDLLLHRIFQSFPAGPDTWEKQLAFYSRVHAEIPAFREELARQNVVNVLFSTELPVAFFSRGPMKSLEDVEGKKWRASSPWQLAWFGNAGAVPISLPWGETYEALRTGSVDGLMVDLYRGHMIGAHGVAPHMLVSKGLWWGTSYLLAMNADTWNGLAEEDREALRRAAETAHRAWGFVMNEAFDALVDDVKKSGVKIRTLNREELKAWGIATGYEKAQAAWVKEREEKGMADAGDVMERVSAILREVMR